MTEPNAKLIVADTETGGLDPKTNPVLTLSAIRTSDGASFNVKIRPPKGLEISPDALRITGLDPVDLHQNGMDEREAAIGFAEFIGKGDHVVAGCNFPFDMRFIGEMFKRQRIPSPLTHRCVDLQTVVVMAHEHGLVDMPLGRNGIPLLNLDAASNTFGVARAGNLHDSLEDVILTQRCIEAAMEKLQTGAKESAEARTNLVFVDAETSGLDPSKHTILRLSALRTSDGKMFDAWVQPEAGTYGDKKALEANGVDVERLKTEGRPLKDVMREFNKFLSEAGPHLLSGCNTAFDVDFVEAACKRFGMRAPFGGKRVDLQTAAYVAHNLGWIELPDKKGSPDLSFTAIAKACGIERQKGAGRSPSDVEIAARCIAKCTRLKHPNVRTGESESPSLPGLGAPVIAGKGRQAEPMAP